MTKNTNQEKRMKVLLLNMLIVFIVTTLITFCIDGFLRHPIPSQGYDAKFDLSKTDTVYANADILFNDEYGGPYDEVLLVELDGQRHLILFARHRFTGRYALRNEAIVEPDFTGNTTLRYGTTAVTMWFENGEIVNRSSFGGMQMKGSPYLGIGMIFTAAESLILWQFLKKKYPAE